MNWLRIKIWIKTKTPILIFLVLFDLIEEGLDRLPRPIRKRLCWLLKHKYKAICFKSDNPDVYVSVADTEEGCVFCGKSSPNTFPMVAEDIDFERTKHRTVPPKHKVLAVSKSD